MNILHHPVLCATTMIMLASCAPRSVYIPMSHNIATFDTVRKLQVTAFAAANHLKLQCNINPAKHLAIAVNLNFGSGIATYDMAAGWYSHSQNLNWHYQAMVGIGYNSNIFLRDPNANGIYGRLSNGFDVLSLYNRYYMQPAITYEEDFGYYNIRYGFSFACRASYLFFKHFRYREIDAEKTVNPEQPVYVVNRTYRQMGLWAFEPALAHTVKRGPFSVSVQLQSISPYSQQIDVSNTRFSPGLLFSTGVSYTVRGKKRQ